MLKDKCVVRNQAYRRSEFSIRERHNERLNESYYNGDIIKEQSINNLYFKTCAGTYEQEFNRMVDSGEISLRGLQANAKVFDELVFDVNSDYFERNGGYEFAKQFYQEAYNLAVQEAGGEEYILSAVMHADERNKALSEQYGRDIFHYHLHVVYIPIVDKEVYFRKNNKDPNLAGKLKEIIKQVSHCKKWSKFRDENGRWINSYSLLQDRFFEHMKAAGYDDIERGERGSTAENLSVIEYKTLKETERAVSLNLQGKDRKEYGESKEMKVAIAYDGAAKTGKQRYELTNKVACANFESAEKFVKRKEGVVAGAFDVDEIRMRFLNGDGASWIKRSKTDETVHIQLDQFHRNKAITRNISNPAAKKKVTELLYAKDIDLMLHVIEVEAQSTEDEDEREKYMALYKYFANNKDGLVPIHRRGLKIPEAPEGKEYRRMGCMESNIYTIIGNRMKGGRACWSIRGGNNLARLLCLKYTHRLSNALKNLSTYVLPERYVEEIITTSVAKIPPRVGKGYNGFNQTLIPSSQKWLKDIAVIKPLYS